MSDKSVSRGLTADIVEHYKSHNPGIEITYYNLDAAPFSFLSSAAFSDEKELAAGAKALDDFIAADKLVIGAPMYNFGIPAQLKAWIDRIAVAGKTFLYTEHGPEGLMHGKKIVIVSSRGGVYSGELSFMDHQESYLKQVFGFLGVDESDIEIIRAEGVNLNPEAAKEAISNAKSSILTL
jgi:FMN-dependent NADH-azoreductase